MTATLTTPEKKPLKILLVEDNPADARLVKELLKDVASPVIILTHAARLHEAVAHMRRDGFNAILLDLSLPDSEGLQTFETARAAHPEAPIIVLTGLHDEVMAAKAVREGAQDYLVKGRVDGASLHRSIRYAIERTQFEESLRASEARYRGLVDGSIQGILIQTEGVIRLANPAIARLLGFEDHRQCIGESLLQFIVPEDRARVQAFMQDCIEGRPVPSRYECNIVTRQGTHGCIDCSLSLIRWDSTPAVLATMVDITELKSAEEALRESEEQFRQAQRMEAVGRLAGGVAHDFNNLLTVITSYAELLLREVGPDQEELRGDIFEIQNAALTAATLTRQLLAFSRQRAIHPRVFSINDVVRDSENLLRRLIGEDVNVNIVLDPASPRVRADAGHLEQVLLNLAVNARDAMPEGGDLTIKVSTATTTSDQSERNGAGAVHEWAVVTVTDTGTGMDEATIQRIFEPFFTTKEFGKGTGLGLATVYGIVKQCGGTVKVHSELDKGSTFTVSLPRVTGDVEEARTAPKSTEVLGAETLLLVEDAVAVRTVIRRALERFGYTILEAADGPSALALASRHNAKIDLVVIDAVLPEVSGWQVAEQLRTQRTGLPILFMSGYAGEMLVRPDALGTWASYLQKPFTPEDLARKVREVLRTSQEENRRG